MSDKGKLVVTAPADRQIVMTRTFNAPRETVFRAFTEPDLVKQWLSGPPGWSMQVCEIDLKVGGGYRYLWNGPGGAVMGMRGVYREVAPPERVVQTEKFDEPWYPGEAVGTMVLAEVLGRTTMTTTIEYDSNEIRDAVLKTPMEQGVAYGYDQLEELLKSMN